MKFAVVAEYFERIEKASGRLDMTSSLSELLNKAGKDEIRKLVYLCQGQLGPAFADVDIGMGEKFVEDSIARVSGYGRDDVNKKYNELGDLGLVAESLLGKKKQSALFSQELSVLKVYDNLLKIAKAEGSGSQGVKIKLLAELLNSASPREAKYITRIPLGRLRLGLGDPTIMDALAEICVAEGKKDKKLAKEVEKLIKAKKEDARKEEFGKRMRARIREMVEEKYNVHSDLGSVAYILKEKGLKGIAKLGVEIGVPIRPSLAERLPSAEEIIKKLGKCKIEAKYDGLRLQCHKDGNKVVIFSRRSENMTHMFPDIVEAVRKEVKAKSAVLEGEALAYNEQADEFYPFQITVQRKRKHGIAEKAREFPLRLFVFDLMYLEGKNIMGLAFRERRKKLSKVVAKGNIVRVTRSITADSPAEIDKFFEESIGKGLEGIIAKDLNAPYIAGARKFSWIKLKRSYKGELDDTVDVVILGYYKGRGHRTKFGLGALLSGVYDSAGSDFKTIAKIGTGFSEEKLVELEKLLSKEEVNSKPVNVDALIEPDVWVSPLHVIEVNADEITKSPMHTCGRVKGEGYALRFPRMVKERVDKKPEDATSVDEIMKMYKAQKHVSTEDAQGVNN